jgi:hypothetical protein
MYHAALEERSHEKLLGRFMTDKELQKYKEKFKTAKTKSKESVK